MELLQLLIPKLPLQHVWFSRYGRFAIFRGARSPKKLEFNTLLCFSLTFHFDLRGVPPRSYPSAGCSALQCRL